MVQLTLQDYRAFHALQSLGEMAKAFGGYCSLTLNAQCIVFGIDASCCLPGHRSRSDCLDQPADGIVRIPMLIDY